jgi:hypothetical protein
MSRQRRKEGEGNGYPKKKKKKKGSMRWRLKNVVALCEKAWNKRGIKQLGAKVEARWKDC